MLTRDIGIAFLINELQKRGLDLTPADERTFEYNMIITNTSGRRQKIKVHVMKDDDWQFNLLNFVKIAHDGKHQRIVGNVDYDNPNTVCILVHIRKMVQPYSGEIYLITLKNLQDIIRNLHESYLNKKNGIRPFNPDSMHTGVPTRRVAQYKNNWGLLND